MSVIKFATLGEEMPSPPAVLIYGGAGSGKTLLSSYFTDPFYIDFDKGLTTLLVKGMRNVKFIPRMNAPRLDYQQLQMLLLSIQREPAQYGKTLVLDSITIMEHNMMDQIMVDAKQELPRFDEFRFLHNRVLGIIEMMKKLPINLVVTAGEYYLRVNESVRTIVPDLTGQLRQEIPLLFDEVWYLKRELTGQYVINTGGDGVAYGKSRWGIPSGTNYEQTVKALFDKYESLRKPPLTNGK